MFTINAEQAASRFPERGYYEGERAPPPLDVEVARELGNLIRKVAYVDIVEISDRTFERIEHRLAEAVEQAALRVVPKNIARMIDTVVTNRTGALEATIAALTVRLARFEGERAAEETGLVMVAGTDETPRPRTSRRRKAKRRKR